MNKQQKEYVVNNLLMEIEIFKENLNDAIKNNKDMNPIYEKMLTAIDKCKKEFEIEEA